MNKSIIILILCIIAFLTVCSVQTIEKKSVDTIKNESKMKDITRIDTLIEKINSSRNKWVIIIFVFKMSSFKQDYVSKITIKKGIFLFRLLIIIILVTDLIVTANKDSPFYWTVFVYYLLKLKTRNNLSSIILMGFVTLKSLE